MVLLMYPKKGPLVEGWVEAQTDLSIVVKRNNSTIIES
jgi:hypothetical protein